MAWRGVAGEVTEERERGQSEARGRYEGEEEVERGEEEK